MINEENFNFASRDPLLDEAFDPIAPLGQDSSTTNTRYLLPAFVLLILLSVYFNRRYGVVTRLPVFLRNSYEKNGIQTPVWIVNWERWIQASSIQRAFESINFSLNLLGRPLPINATPIERARQLGRILPKAMQNIHTLLDEHQTSLYTSREANISQARRAANQIRWLALIERTRYIFEGKPIENP